MKPFTTHELKCWPEPFEAMRSGRKKFEYRRNDRDYQVGDILYLAEWCPERREFSGRGLAFAVTYILPGGWFNVPEGYCVMSVVRSAPLEADNG